MLAAASVDNGASRLIQHDQAILRILHVASRNDKDGSVRSGTSCPRAISKGELVQPTSVERYLAGKFGEHLAAARSAMTQLATALPPRELAERAFQLYDEFRPEVPPDERGWGAKGVLDLDRITLLAGRDAAH